LTESPRLIPYAEALQIVLENVRPLPVGSVSLDEALGAYLARPVKARSHSPRFEQSAMDGYAVRLADVVGAGVDPAVGLHIAGELAAGDGRAMSLRPGETIKVFTGSRLPSGCEAVVMKEYVRCEGRQAFMAGKVGAGDHIRRVGEEYRRGDVIMPAGTRINPPVIGMLAMLGRDKAAVRRRPIVTVITMGDELVAPGQRLGPGQIPDANGPALLAALRSLGIDRTGHRRVPDDHRKLHRAMAAALDRSDLVVTVGGASVGDHDHVGRVRQDLGIRDLFSKLAIKPGKPNLFGMHRGRTPIFGLPGNPVSALVSFHQLVKPAVARLMGAPIVQSPMVPVRLRHALRKKPGRLNWLRGRLYQEGTELVAELATGQGSHMLSGLAAADALVEIPQDVESVTGGEVLMARLLDWES